ncbi:MAG: peptide-methionine (S)-S-oxide reductase MsrA [Eubacterium sp.]|nr:peptide-methionine (S)-S-oxide reductase MsrA [Eubacterium sp.]
MNGDTGEAHLVVKSDLTVSVGYYKQGQFKGDADKYIGRLTNADIGIVLVDDIQTIYLAGGCFWGMQKYLDQFDGVISTEVGYANGPDFAPSYEDVCSDSGHAETVKIDFDSGKIDLEELLDHYFLVIDPLSVNQQGNDKGIQYRTGIFYTDDEQLPVIQKVFDREQAKAGRSLAVIVEPLRNFYTAEEYHQKYLDKNPGGYCHIPKSYFTMNEKDKRNE